VASKGVQDLRALFPVTKGYSYLNSAAVGPLSAPARNAMRRLIRDQCDRGGARLEQWGETIEACRAAAARLIGAQPDEVALVPNTSAGLATVAAGLHAAPGENIVIPEREFPSNVYPWMALPGVEVRQVPKRDGRLLADEVARCVDSRTRAVSVSFVDWLTGHRPDLKAIGKVARHYGALFVVDAIQGAGALPLDVGADAIDALAFGAHKWICGPEGVAVLYVSRLARERIAPTRPSWMSVRRAGQFLDYDLAPASGARRYEDGTPNTCGIYGLLAALDLIADVTVPVIAERVRRATRPPASSASCSRTPRST